VVRFIIAHEATAKILIRRTGILRTRSSFRLKSTWYFRFAEFIQPLRGCGTSVRCWPRVSPAVIDIQALRACLCNSEIYVLKLSGSHEELPLSNFLPRFFQSGISDVACNVSTGATLNSSLFTLHFFLPHIPSSHLLAKAKISCKIP